MFVAVLVLLLVAACGGAGQETAAPNLPGSPVPGTVPPTVFQAPAGTEPAATGEPAAPVTGTLPAGQDQPAGTAAVLALTLPDGTVKQMPVVKCEGIGDGENLDVLAANTQDRSDPARIEVQVSGAHTTTGTLDNMYVSVIIGAENAWTFMGNTPAAPLTLLPNGSGQFDGIAIANTAVESPDYAYNQEYSFSGGWTCEP